MYFGCCILFFKRGDSLIFFELSVFFLLSLDLGDLLGEGDLLFFLLFLTTWFDALWLTIGDLFLPLDYVLPLILVLIAAMFLSTYLSSLLHCDESSFISILSIDPPLSICWITASPFLFWIDVTFDPVLDELEIVNG